MEDDLYSKIKYDEFMEKDDNSENNLNFMKEYFKFGDLSNFTNCFDYFEPIDHK